MESFLSAESFFSGMLWKALFYPLGRLLLVMTFSLALAQLLEAFRWTDVIARLTAPLVRLARLGPVAGASFPLAFFSPAAANALLAEGVAGGAVSRRELICANIFNSTPAFFVHLPSLAAVAYAAIGPYAVIYILLIFCAASMRTVGTALAGRLFLPPLPPESACTRPETPPRPWQKTLALAFSRLKKRVIKMLVFTTPIYCLLFFVQKSGFFAHAETFMAAYLGDGSFLRPQALSIVAMYLAAESNAAFFAAASLLSGGAIQPAEALMALLVGNILSSPMRAFRHQLPSYAGYFSPGMALVLVSVNQSLRAASLMLVTAAYYLLWRL